MNTLRSLRSILVIFIFTSSLSVVKSQWAFQGCPESGLVLDYAVDDNRIFLLAKGELFYTDNVDFLWQRMNMPDTFPVEGKIFASENRLYLFSDIDFFNPGSAAVLYRTDDMGVTWKNITPQSDSWGRGVNIVVHRDSLFISAYGDLLVSFDAGDTYNAITDQLIGYDILYLNHHLFTYNDTLLFKSDNYGISWDTIYEAHDTITKFDAFVVDQVLYRIESGATSYFEMWYSIYSSTDEGNTWEYKSNVGAFHFAEPTIMGEQGHLFFAANKYKTDDLLYSTDQGEHWIVPDGLPELSYEYTDGLLFCQGINEPTISIDYGQTFQSYTLGFTAAMVTEAAPGVGLLYANTKDALYLKNASQQWSLIPDSKSIAYLDDDHLVGYIDNIPRRSSDGGITWEPIPASAFGLANLPGLSGEVFGIGNAFVWSSYYSHWYSLDYGITWHAFEFSGGSSVIHTMAHEQGRYIIHNNEFQTFSSTNLVDWVNIYNNADGYSVFPESVACQNGYVMQTIGPFVAWLAPNETEWELIIPEIEGINDVFHSPLFTFMENVGNVLIGGISGRGVFISYDLGINWHPVNEGLDDFHTRSLVIAKDTLYLGVDGGVWTRPISDLLETSIKEPGKKLALTASPNPTKDFIMVTFRESVSDGEVMLSLYDTKGALVKTKTSVSPENIQMDVKDLSSGVYYLHARIGRDQGTICILKN